MAENNNQIFNEYIVQGDGSRKQRAENWQIAIGLQDVDRLQNSAYLLNTARQHIEGELDIAAVQQRIEDYYRTTEGRELASQRTDEADIVATRISAILAEKTFAFIPSSYANLHKRLFNGVFKHAGEYRTVNISKREWVLDGESVIYAPYELLRETIEYDFTQERNFSYMDLSPVESVRHIAKFISGLWQIHPFISASLDFRLTMNPSGITPGILEILLFGQTLTTTSKESHQQHYSWKDSLRIYCSAEKTN